jgi:hypothetical protein
MDAKMALKQEFMDANKRQLDLAKEKMNCTNRANKMLQSHTNGKWGSDEVISDSASRISGANGSANGSSITAKRMTTQRQAQHTIDVTLARKLDLEKKAAYRQALRAQVA